MIPKAFIFDVFGTLVDWRNSVARDCAAVFAQKQIAVDPHEFAAAWRAQYDPAMARIRDGGRGYVRLEVLHLENLDIVLSTFGISDAFDEAEKARLNLAWERLDPWPDVVAGLAALKPHAKIAPCSNGSVALMTNLATYGALQWDDYVGAERAQDYKPKPEVYLKSCEWLDCAPSEVMMVAAHNRDLDAARKAGLKTGFFPRPTEFGPDQSVDLVAESAWDIIAEDLVDLSHKALA